MKPDSHDQSPPTGFTRTLEAACGTAENPNLGNRAKLRRSLRSAGSSMATTDALVVIGRAIGDRDTRETVEMKAGVAALYAAHGKPGRSQLWRGPASHLRDAVHNKKISNDRAGRELLGILRETDPANIIRRVHRTLTLCANSTVDTSRTDWDRLLADMLAFTGDNKERRQRAETRWGRDFA